MLIGVLGTEAQSYYIAEFVFGVYRQTAKFAKINTPYLYSIVATDTVWV